ncbi:hypothetical protein B566_EDAN014203 [Ephemera danica]|nr:hypothetical protein B566_EDAN014203 [Ephemera danica]
MLLQQKNLIIQKKTMGSNLGKNLFKKGSGFKVNLLDATLLVRKMTISHTVLLAHTKALENATAKYAISRVNMKSITISKDIRSKSIDNLYLGQLPTRVIVGFVSNSALNGDIKNQPIIFRTLTLIFFVYTLTVVKFLAKLCSQNLAELLFIIMMMEIVLIVYIIHMGTVFTHLTEIQTSVLAVVIVLRSDIVTAQYFIGVYSADTLPTRVTYPCALIANTDISSKSGVHWIAIFNDNLINMIVSGLPCLCSGPISSLSLLLGSSPLTCLLSSIMLIPLATASSSVCGKAILTFSPR